MQKQSFRKLLIFFFTLVGSSLYQLQATNPHTGRLGFLLNIDENSENMDKGLNATSGDFTPTPANPKGPFYPLSIPLDHDSDLTYVKHHTLKAKGKEIIITGGVFNEEGEILKNAIVEVWQACQTGRYNHPSDLNPALIDENFQYYGVTKTNNDGNYRFLTIIPGAYPASADWYRPPHIHFLISMPGYRSLITQVYFKDHNLNEGDLILRRLSAEDQKRLTVKFNDVVDENGFEHKIGTFNIVLRKK